jgi:hypothetical protein
MNYSEDEVNEMLWVLRDQKGSMGHAINYQFAAMELWIKENKPLTLSILQSAKKSIMRSEGWEKISGVDIPSYFIRYYINMIKHIEQEKDISAMERLDRKRQSIHKLILLYARHSHGDSWDVRFNEEIQKRLLPISDAPTTSNEMTSKR